MNKIIVISGKQYSGKDTFAAVLLNILKDYRRIGIGDAIKIEYAKTKGLTLDEVINNKHLYRNDLIALGNHGRAISPVYWLNNLSNMDKIIVPDIRMQFEADYFKNKGAFLIRVNSTLENRQKRGIITNIDDETETQLDNYNNWNCIIDNDFNMEYLKNKAIEVVKIFNDFIKD